MWPGISMCTSPVVLVTSALKKWQGNLCISFIMSIHLWGYPSVHQLDVCHRLMDWECTIVVVILILIRFQLDWIPHINPLNYTPTYPVIATPGKMKLIYIMFIHQHGYFAITCKQQHNKIIDFVKVCKWWYMIWFRYT